MKKENKTDQTDDDELFQQFLLQGVDGTKNELGAVIDRYDFDPFRQRTLDLLNLFLDPLDDRQGVLPEADDDDAASGPSARGRGGRKTVRSARIIWRSNPSIWISGIRSPAPS